jgi:hypothetical protein
MSRFSHHHHQIIIDSEVQCTCGHVQCVADMKRSVPREGWTPHPHLTCDDINEWKMLNVSGSEQRWKLMRFKSCPKCGTVTQKCGCPSSNIVCNGLDKCPNEGERSFLQRICALSHAFCSVRSYALLEV